ncbi:MAG TPA: protealysin inhibitor emfourin [Actinoplanes sp.]|jgi:hypothetical protein
MRVILKEHGGLAAAINRHAPARVADTRSLPADQAAELDRLVRAALSAAAGQPADPNASPAAGPGTARDAMSYTVIVEDAAGTSVLTGSDTAASQQFSELLRWLQDHAHR